MDIYNLATLLHSWHRSQSSSWIPFHYSGSIYCKRVINLPWSASRPWRIPMWHSQSQLGWHGWHFLENQQTFIWVELLPSWGQESSCHLFPYSQDLRSLEIRSCVDINGFSYVISGYTLPPPIPFPPLVLIWSYYFVCVHWTLSIYIYIAKLSCTYLTGLYLCSSQFSTEVKSQNKPVTSVYGHYVPNP